MHAGWSCTRLNDGPNIKLVELCKLAGDELCFVCCLVIRGSGGGEGGDGISWWFSFVPVFQWCHNTLFLSGPHF